MQEFDAIRPYSDEETAPAIKRLVNDREFLDMVGRFKSPLAAKWAPAVLRMFVRRWLVGNFGHYHRVDDLQAELSKYVGELVESTTSRVTHSGLENLSKTNAHLFISNHRDIVFDPMVVNYLLFQNGFLTTRIAIGDNLLQNRVFAEMMRLNKSFIVHRSLTGRREKLQAYQTLSAYISHSIAEGQSIWIAQAEGRAKDGLDETDSAIIKMFCRSRKAEAVADVIRSLSMVPVSISYEWDPCDGMKARELEQRAHAGSYSKEPGEDDRSIAMGLTGYKGRVHVAFGKPLTEAFDDARQVAAAVDRQILGHYRLYPSNFLAFEHSGEQVPTALSNWRTDYTASELAAEEQRFAARLSALPEAQRPFWLLQYANPVRSRLRVIEESAGV